MVAEGGLPEEIPNDGDIDINMVIALKDDGLITVNIHKLYGTSLVSSPRLTLKGEEHLKKSKLSFRIVSAFHNVTAGTWKLILLIVTGIIIGYVVTKFG